MGEIGLPWQKDFFTRVSLQYQVPVVVPFFAITWIAVHFLIIIMSTFFVIAPSAFI